MSENINNREYRKNVIKQVIKELHEGKTVEEVKQKFEEAFTGVSASEISEAEQALINEGLPVSEVQRLCDVHSAVFKGSIEEIHRETDPMKIPGHPANVLYLENRRLERIIEEKIKPYLEKGKESLEAIQNGLEELSVIDIHYSKKENLLFPYMEKYGITAPPKVMWGVDDEIRDDLKTLKSDLSYGVFNDELKKGVEELINRINEMIFKEESIMLPMLLDIMTQDEWKKVADDSSEIGNIIDFVPVWNPDKEAKKEHKEDIKEPGAIILPTGVFNTEELTHMLNTLPIDITFVGSDDKVKYFSQSSERIFARTKTIIGRNVSNCHPPASVHIVEGIVEDFKSGKKDHEDFWIKMGDKYVYIRYFAVRNEEGKYLGVVEVTQNIKPIQEITGEKRLVED
ncbi:MAG TPA: PAS domain S-box protein [Clostridiales bacterium]|nr:PAS domain S-box protein [Clostridiales bacterium]